MEINNSIGLRLLEERERMGKTQSEFAGVAMAAGVPGATRQSQAKYEKGLATPSAAYMSAIAVAGVDVLFILTGTRATTHAALGHVRTASEMAGKLGGTKQEQAERAEAAFHQLHQPLPADEQMLLDTYREWSPEVKKRELRRAMGLAAAGPDLSAPSTPSMGNKNVNNNQAGMTMTNSTPGGVQVGFAGGKVSVKKGK